MKADDLISTMASFVGTKENPPGSNRTPIGREFATRPDGEAWCAKTISVACNRLGFPLHEAAVIRIEQHARAGDWGMGWSRSPVRASAVCFDFGGRGNWADMHTGLVYQVLNANQFRTIEGNYHDQCTRVLRDMKYVRGFATFPFEAPATSDPISSTWPPFMPEQGRYSLYPFNKNKPTLKLGQANDYVRYLQGVLKNKANAAIAVDGVFGEVTRSRVMNVQRFFKLGVDGIVGPATWRVIDYLAGH